MTTPLSWEYLHTTPGIYTFLGLATLPRFRTQTNNLRILPRVIIDRIARLAHRDSYLAAFDTWESPGGRLPTAKDITELNDEADLPMRMARPVRTGVTYVEVTTSAAWYGTRLTLTDDEMGNGYEFGMQLDCDERAALSAPEREICLMRLHGRYLQIKSLGNNSWTWSTDPVTFGVLVDMNRGCVAFRLNGVDGPCVRFPGAEWTSHGVWIELDQFPSGEHLPVDETGETYPLVVSCATAPVPPSLLEAAANPLTGPEHVAAGASRT